MPLHLDDKAIRAREVEAQDIRAAAHTRQLLHDAVPAQATRRSRLQMGLHAITARLRAFTRRTSAALQPELFLAALRIRRPADCEDC